MKLLSLLAAAVAAAGPAADVERLERRVRELGRRVEAGLREGVDAAVALSATVETLRVADERKKALDPLILELAVASSRLDAYRRTGRLPPDDPAAGRRFRKMIEEPWSLRTPLPELQTGIAALEKQLRRYDLLLGRPPAPAERRAPAPDPAVARKSGPIEELISLLGSPEPRMRALAADELGKRGPTAALAAAELRRLLSDGDARVRGSAVLALGEIPGLPAEAVEDVRRTLQDGNKDVRLSAERALRRLGLALGRELDQKSQPEKP